MASAAQALVCGEPGGDQLAHRLPLGWCAAHLPRNTSRMASISRSHPAGRRLRRALSGRPHECTCARLSELASPLHGCTASASLALRASDAGL